MVSLESHEASLQATSSGKNPGAMPGFLMGTFSLFRRLKPGHQITAGFNLES
jgi:hypothetical protein